MQKKLIIPAILAFALSAPQSTIAEPGKTSLRDAFADDFLVGAAIGRHQIMGGDPAAMRLVEQQFNTLTAENSMKWERIEPLENQFDWEAADALVEYAEKAGMEIAGHVLVWHSQVPDWVFQDAEGKPASRELLLARMENHINTVVTRYKGRVQSWEVLNEALNEDGSLRETHWLTIIGEDYIEKAFEFAHAADPEAKLYYNDYNLYKPEKAAGARALIAALQEKGLAVHGAGMQGHYGLDQPDSMEDFEAAIRGFGDMGLEVYITEMDLSVLPFPPQADWGADISVDLALNDKYNPYADGLPADVEEKQAARYSELFRILQANRDAVARVTFWGIDDGHSWKNNWPMNGRTDYPLLFDREYQPKPVYHEVVGLAKQKPE